MRGSLVRSRWAAIGAAVAVALGAGGLHLAQAVVAPPANPVTTLVSPCRLMDTRAGVTNVGPRSTPLGAGEVYTATARGTNGQCTIPSTASGIIANVTIVGPTAASYLTVWPSDKSQPTASNLNWVGGQAPTANQVTTALSAADGKIKLFNAAGTVDLIVDITGYLTPADLTNYYTKAQVDSANATQNSTVSSLLATVSSLQANTYTKAQVDSAVAAAAACKGYPHIGVDWHGCNLSAANLTSANFVDANLAGSNLNYAYLHGASLNGTNLTGANLTSTTLVGASFINANLTNADLTGANLYTASNLSTATLTGVTWTSAVCPDGTFAQSHSDTCIGHL